MKKAGRKMLVRMTSKLICQASNIDRCGRCRQCWSGYITVRLLLGTGYQGGCLRNQFCCRCAGTDNWGVGRSSGFSCNRWLPLWSVGHECAGLRW